MSNEEYLNILIEIEAIKMEAEGMKVYNSQEKDPENHFCQYAWDLKAKEIRELKTNN
jgi:hypothetical protein